MANAVDKNVQYLDMSVNQLEEDGARAFKDFLAQNNTLRVLKLNTC